MIHNAIFLLYYCTRRASEIALSPDLKALFAFSLSDSSFPAPNPIYASSSSSSSAGGGGNPHGKSIFCFISYATLLVDSFSASAKYWSMECFPTYCASESRC